MKDELYAVLQAIAWVREEPSHDQYPLSAELPAASSISARKSLSHITYIHLEYERALQLTVVQSQLRQVGQQDLL